MMQRLRIPFPSRRPLPLLLAALALVVATATATAPAAAAAQDGDANIGNITTMTNLGEKALRLYDELDFKRAEVVLEQALKIAETSGLEEAPLTARIHLYLGMVRLAGLEKRDAAAEQFRIARRIDPTVTPPEGLFNPEVAALFAATQAEPPGDGNPAAEVAAPPPAPPAPPPPRVKERRAVRPVESQATREAAGDDETPPDEDAPFLLALGLGTGGGTASGHIDMKGVTPNTAPGRFAMSQLAHATVTAGYFWSSALLVSVEARLQLVTGATPHCDGTMCSDTSGFAAAALLKLSYFLGQDALRWFGTVGLGGGTIQQVVKLTGLPDCGRSGDQQCFDTVTGGPFLMAAGGGLAYQLDALVLLAGVTANVGVPHIMLNVDLTVGAGFRF